MSGTGRSTETLFAPGCVIGNVSENQMNDLIKAGKYVWDAQYIMHRLVIMNAKRLE